MLAAVRRLHAQQLPARCCALALDLHGCASSHLRHVASRTYDPWAVLGVSPKDDLDSIKDAYRRLALALHPDVCREADSATRFSEVVRAYDVIANGDDDERVRPRGSSGHGARVVGGVLITSIDELRRDPEFHVYTLQLALDGDTVGTVDEHEDANAPPRAEEPAADGDAVSTERVHLLRASEWDSVGDVRRALQEQLRLSPSLRYEHGRHREGGHELIARGGQLLGEHLFLADYELRSGDTLFFAVRQNRCQSRRR